MKNKIKIIVFALVLSFFTTTNLYASIFGDGFGVNIKTERITDKELAEIAKMGIKRVRIGISWYMVEYAPGKYRWDYKFNRRSDADDYATTKNMSYDDVIALIVKNGLKIDATLHEGNAGITGLVNIAPAGQTPSYRHVAPRTPEHMQMFAKFAAETVKHYEAKYGKNVFIWHIWNEPDTDSGFPPTTDAGLVGKLVTETCQAIKSVSRGTRVMAPALGAYGDGFLRYDYIKGMFSLSNPLTCLNAFTVHPYRSAPPEAAIRDYKKVEEVLAPYQPTKKVPVSVDEWGYSINKNTWDIPTQRWRSRTQEEQAALMFRMYLTNLIADLPLTVLYDWRDNGLDQYDWEHHFGIKGYNGQEKAAAKMFNFVWPNLNGRGYAWRQRIAGCSANEELVKFSTKKGDATNWTVIWSQGQKRKISIEGQIIKMSDIFGNDITPTEISGYPILIQHMYANIPKIKCVN